MRNKLSVWGIALVAIFLLASPSAAEVDWKVVQTLNVDETPIATEVAPGGQYIYVLTQGGKLMIYDGTGKLEDTLEVGVHIDGLKAGAGENLLFLTSSAKKTVDIVNLSFIRKIPTDGSPFKGKAEVPVELVVFSDFQ